MYLNLVLAISSYLLPQATTPKILFFTGGNSFMPIDIYSDFISKLKNNYDVSVIKNSNSNFNKESSSIIEQLFDYTSENEIVPIGHSSGCTTLLNYCTKLKNVNKCILMDPVDNNLNKDNTYNFESILQINAQKSYRWKANDNFPMNPIPKVPFIPAFAMDTNKFKNLTKLTVSEYGHCDILDTAFSNVMHNTFAEGNSNRNSLVTYREFLVELIEKFINNENLDPDNFNNFDIEYTVN